MTISGFFNAARERFGISIFGRSFWEADEGFSFFENPLIRSVLVASLLVVLLSFAVVSVFIMRSGSETIVLHYNAYFGIDIVGSPLQSLFVPSVAAGICLLNVALARRFYMKRERIAAHILLFSGLFAVCAGIVAALSLSFINS